MARQPYGALRTSQNLSQKKTTPDKDAASPLQSLRNNSVEHHSDPFIVLESHHAVKQTTSRSFHLVKTYTIAEKNTKPDCDENTPTNNPNSFRSWDMWNFLYCDNACKYWVLPVRHFRWGLLFVFGPEQHFLLTFSLYVPSICPSFVVVKVLPHRTTLGKSRPFINGEGKPDNYVSNILLNVTKVRETTKGKKNVA